MMRKTAGTDPKKAFANEYDDGRKEKVYDVTVPSCGEWRVKPTAPAIDEAKIAKVLSAMGIVNVYVRQAFAGRSQTKTAMRKSKVEANRKKRSKELSQL